MPPLGPEPSWKPGRAPISEPGARLGPPTGQSSPRVTGFNGSTGFIGSGARGSGAGPSWRVLRTRSRTTWFWCGALLLLPLCAFAWVIFVYRQIRTYAVNDQARPADAIAVFGAAEYDGRPSPVLRARLDHGLELYQEKLAPLIITLGGGDPAERHSEGGVGEDYLLAHGVPESAIIAETRSRDTRESAERLAAIARVNGLRRIVVVSDGTHLFRIHALCSAAGLTVYTSPRRELRPLAAGASAERLMHEILSYTAFRLHLH